MTQIGLFIKSFRTTENEEENPCEPLHWEKGLNDTTSTVTLMAAENPHTINDRTAITAEEVLTAIAGTMATGGNHSVDAED